MEKVLVPTNFMSWPRVKNLLPDQKLIARELWCNQFIKMCGAYQLPAEMFAVSLGLSVVAVEAALADFERLELIVWDKKTGEVYVLDWLRFHKFKGIWLTNYLGEISKIESTKIQKIIIEKSILAGLKMPENSPIPKESIDCSPVQHTVSHAVSVTPPPLQLVGGGGGLENLVWPPTIHDCDLKQIADHFASNNFSTEASQQSLDELRWAMGNPARKRDVESPFGWILKCSSRLVSTPGGRKFSEARAQVVPKPAPQPERGKEVKTAEKEKKLSYMVARQKEMAAASRIKLPG